MPKGSVRVLPRQSLGVAAAFLAVYIIWGSTYFAIRIAVGTIPPLLMAGVRFLIAGTLMYGWLRLRGAPRPTPRQWGSAIILGLLLLVMGNGGVTLAEQLGVPSGVAAVLVAMVPLYMALIAWALPGGKRPTLLMSLGLLGGFAGVALLLWPSQVGGSPVTPAAGIILVGSFCWALGSLYSRTAPQPKNPLVGTGMEMLAGGVLLTAMGLATGEGSRFDPGKFSMSSLLAFGFLIIFGSIVAFSAYIWLLRVVSPTRVSTYAYVNPVVAVFLGASFGGEAINARMLIAMAIILSAVVVITLGSAAQARIRANIAARSEVAVPSEEPATTISR
ncbi:MAG TPA: drug/metabolite exporter YedA [Ktedonobacterales bacterium]